MGLAFSLQFSAIAPARVTVFVAVLTRRRRLTRRDERRGAEARSAPRRCAIDASEVIDEVIRGQSRPRRDRD
jgi:hypothetical protein